LSQSSQAESVSAESTEPIPTAPPMPISPADWINV
jgi:hypothetical protein